MTCAGTASASDQNSRTEEIAVCTGLSPHILDVAHTSDLQVSEDSANPGVVDAYVSTSPDLWGNYRSHPTITWTNLATGISGTLTGKSQVIPSEITIAPFAAVGTSYDNVPTGSGPVHFDLSVVNVGTFPVPAITCNGNFDVD